MDTAAPWGASDQAHLGAVDAAVAFSVTVNAAVDLHRFDMLKALHLPLPKTLSDELTTNASTCDFLRQGRSHLVEYVHPKAEANANPKVETGAANPGG